MTVGARIAHQDNARGVGVNRDIPRIGLPTEGAVDNPAD